MSRAAKRPAKPRRITTPPGPFEPWQEGAAEKFGVSVSVVAEHFRPEDVTRIERVFAGRTLAAFPLAALVGEENCFLRAFTLQAFAVPFLIEHLDVAIPSDPSVVSWIPRRAVGDRELRIVAAQAKRLAASFRALGPIIQPQLLWTADEEEYGARCEPFLAALDDIADVAAGKRWGLPQVTTRDSKRATERAIAEEMALHRVLSSYRDGLTAKVLRFAYDASGFQIGADPSRTLRAMLRTWSSPKVATKLAVRRADLEGILRAGALGDPLVHYWHFVGARVEPPDETEDIPF